MMQNRQAIITIAGGGSSYTPGIIQAILHNADRLPVKELRLYDIDAQRNEDMQLIIDFMLKQEGHADVKLVATLDPKEAFTDVDFVFTQIRVGGMDMRSTDEKIPLKYGLVGQETCGLGGFAYGLRTIGRILELAGWIQEYAPNAWMLNYTNPESIVAEAIRRSYPDAKIINACDMTISLEETIARNYGYDRKNWISTYYGLNHFGWYSEIYDKSLGRDIMPELIQKLNEQDLEVADFNEGDTTWQEAFRMLSVMTRSFSDQIPNNYLEYYLYPDMVVEKADKTITRADMIKEGREKNTREMAEKIRAGQKESVLQFNFGEHGQYIVDMATSLRNDERQRFMLIVPNNGSIPNLRPDATVEVPAYVGATGVEAIALKKPICDFHKGLMEAQNAAEKLLVDAYFENSYQKALQAFTLNQSVPSARVAKQVLDEMIVANKDYWPILR